jgi:mannose-6-phosphate isomerase-like protein (cupin superfamily)
VLTKSIASSLVNRRGGQTSHVLLAKGEFGSRRLTITWVECPPGSVQPVHRHEGAEQVYVIVTGRGRMIVGKAEQEVSRGTLVFVPPSTDHAIKNEGQEVLTFVSATSPPFGPDDLGPSLRFVRQAG